MITAGLPACFLPPERRRFRNHICLLPAASPTALRLNSISHMGICQKTLNCKTRLYMRSLSLPILCDKWRALRGHDLNNAFRKQGFQRGNIIETIMGVGAKAFARAGSGENGNAQSCAGISCHVQIVIIVADHCHACRRKTNRVAETENHAGLRLRAVTAVITGDEIDIAFETETDRRLADGFSLSLEAMPSL